MLQFPYLAALSSEAKGGIGMERKKKHSLTAIQSILLGFFVATLVFSVLLYLPWATAPGEHTSYLDALFTAAASVSVTGLTVVNTATHWSLFGQIVILIGLQVGSLGIVSFTTGVLVVLGRRITLRDRILLENDFNLDTLSGIETFLRGVVIGSLIGEALGTLLFLPVFVPEFGARGVWIALFHAVSSFCNAGMDIIGGDSLAPYAGDLWLNLVTMLLVVAGGVGFVVWRDIHRVVRLVRRGEVRPRQFFHRLTLHSKISLSAYLVLLLGGWLLYGCFEWTNPATLGAMAPGERVLGALFQSVTARTAGFYTVPQTGLRGSSLLLTIVLMFIGGSSVSAAGGVKTTTVALVALSAWSVVKGEPEATAFRRTISHRLVRRASAVILLSILFLLGCTTLLSLLHGGGDLTDLFFEMTGVLSTTGLTRGICPELNAAGRFLVICCMYFGRVGPFTLAIGLARRQGGLLSS